MRPVNEQRVVVYEKGGRTVPYDTAYDDQATRALVERCFARRGRCRIVESRGVNR